MITKEDKLLFLNELFNQFRVDAEKQRQSEIIQALIRDIMIEKQPQPQYLRLG